MDNLSLTGSENLVSYTRVVTRFAARDVWHRSAKGAHG